MYQIAFLEYKEPMSVAPEKLAATLVARRRMLRGARDKQVLDLLARLRAAVHDELVVGSIHRAWLIGSLASGRFGEHSDVDVVAEGLAAADAGAVWDRLCAAIGMEIDLLRMEELADPFRTRVLAEGIALHVA